MLKNKIFKNTLIYGLSNALYSGLPFLLIPFMVSVLQPEEYGKIDLFRTISMIFTPIIGLSAVQSIGYHYFELSKEHFKTFVSSVQIFQLFTSLLAIIIIWILSFWIPKDIYILLLLSVTYFLFNQFIESLLVIYRLEDYSKKYLIVRILNISLELLIMFILFNTLTFLNWTLRVYPIIISSLIVAIFCLYKFKKMDYKLNFSYKLLTKALIYSTPLILHMISGYILNIGDRFFIKYFIGNKKLGDYAVAYQLGMSVNFFFTSFNLAWTPTYFRWMKDDKTSAINRVKKIVYYSIIIIGIITFLGWLLLKNLVLENTKYEISSHLVLIVLISNVILSLYKFESNYYMYNKQTKKLSLITFLSAIIAILLNSIFIPIFGIIGAGYTTLTSFTFMFIFVKINIYNEKNNIKNSN
jgi:O-antigen/teichoic acid export membrane protein